MDDLFLLCSVCQFLQCASVSLWMGSGEQGLLKPGGPRSGLLAWGALPFPAFQVEFASHSFHLNQGLLCRLLSLLAFMAWNPSLPTPSSPALLGAPGAWLRAEGRDQGEQRGRGRANSGQMPRPLCRDPVCESEGFRLGNIGRTVPGAQAALEP